MPDKTGPDKGNTLKILGYTAFTFLVYLSMGLPLAVLPTHVHLAMGFSTTMAGFVISVQYMATLISRPWAGRISDTYGPKISVVWGMALCAFSGLLLTLAPMAHAQVRVGLGMLIASRLVLGFGESLGSTGATLWGISGVGPEHTVKVIGWNGICTYSALAFGAPLGVILQKHWGLEAIGVLTLTGCVAGFLFAIYKENILSAPGEHLPFRQVLGRVTPYGVVLALGGVGYSVLATFAALLYNHRHWDGAVECLTAFGLAYVASRVFFMGSIDRWGAFPVGLISLAIESVGTMLVWQARAPWMAVAGALLTGLGLSLVFPAMGVEAVRRVPQRNRGAALGVYTGFADVSFFLVGPVAGALIEAFGYPSAFLFAFLCVLTALGITQLLSRQKTEAVPA
ncbi:MFS transporter [Silvibacterium acidisoli]|uniref:MFS transporter n=1 Tax=Acidobacteriaceae bacterium ZG23-2 TaxID=2883246 RepID=UPI00406C77B9